MEVNTPLHGRARFFRRRLWMDGTSFPVRVCGFFQLFSLGFRGKIRALRNYAGGMFMLKYPHLFSPIILANTYE